MAKMHKLTKGGQTIFPATIYDAVVNPISRKSLATEISEIDARISGKKEYSVGKNIINPLNLTDGYYLGQNGSLKQNASYCVTTYIRVKNSTQYHISNTGVGGAYHVIFDDKLKALTAIKDETVTTPENAAYIRLSISKSQLGAAQMELGDVATSYEPFTDNYDNEQKFMKLETQMMTDKTELKTQMASDRTELEMQIADKKSVSLGKNLFNKSTVKNGYYIDASGNLKTNSTLSLSYYIKVNPNTSYYIQNTNTGGASNVWFDKEFNAIKEAAKSGVTTSPSNVAYIRLSISTAVIDDAMFFEGSTTTSYEPYTENYDNEQRFAAQEKEINNTNTALDTLQSQMPKVVVGKNLFDPDKADNGFLRQNGTVANSTTYVTSDYIAVEGKRTITAHPLALGPIYFSQYDSSKEFITSIQNAQTLTVTLESNTAYVRATFLASNYKTEGQIEYGLTSTEYEPFHYVISEESLPGGIGGGTTRDEVKQINHEEVYPAKFVL